jgi:serine/threonine protein phosphatase 1
MKKRTLIIGDIHGGLRALTQVLERANLSIDDQLIFLGDYVDGWSESAQVIAFLIQLQQKYTCIFIKGNHDAWCELWLEQAVTNEVWLRNGGAESIASYERISVEERAVHLAFFNNMKYYFIDEQNRLFVHAGFTSMHGVKQETDAQTFYWDRTLWETALALDKSLSSDSLYYPKRLKVYQEIFIGHTPSTNYGIEEPMIFANVCNVDTGAAFKGKITVMDIDTKTFWQSDPLPMHYPDEKGRNK